jgi:hypothetical protein
MSVILPVDLRTKTTLSNDDLMQNFQAIANLLAGGITALQISPAASLPLTVFASVRVPIELTFLDAAAGTSRTWYSGLDSTLNYVFKSFTAISSAAPGASGVVVSTSPDGTTFTVLVSPAFTVVGNVMTASLGSTAIPSNTAFLRFVVTTTNSVILSASAQISAVLV